MSIWNAPLKVAQAVYVASNIALVIAAALGLSALTAMEDSQSKAVLGVTTVLVFVGTIGAFWAGGVKDRHGQPRHLSAQSAKKLLLALGRDAALTNQGESLTAAVFAISPSFEAQYLADQLAEALALAGFKINRYPVQYGLDHSVQGIGVLTSDLPEALARGKSVIAALKTAGLVAVLAQPRAASKTDASFDLSFSLMVGDRP